MATISRDTIYTNVALTPDLDVWWEGKTPKPPPELSDWQGKPWTPAIKNPRRPRQQPFLPRRCQQSSLCA